MSAWNKRTMSTKPYIVSLGQGATRPPPSHAIQHGLTELMFKAVCAQNNQIKSAKPALPGLCCTARALFALWPPWSRRTGLEINVHIRPKYQHRWTILGHVRRELTKQMGSAWPKCLPSARLFATTRIERETVYCLVFNSSDNILQQ